MSDYPNPNLRRDSGVSARGLLIGLAVIVILLAALSLFGAGPAPTDATVGQDAIAPAAETVGVPVE